MTKANFLELKTSDIVESTKYIMHGNVLKICGIIIRVVKRHYDVINFSVSNDATTQKRVS